VSGGLGGQHAGHPRRQDCPRVDVTFTLPAEVQAGTVALCGEFNDWSAAATQLERSGDESWQVTIALEPGRSYRHRYLLDGQRWENDGQADRQVPNALGSIDSVVAVG
jgi:1,4-alpha-glucan branching enzyme